MKARFPINAVLIMLAALLCPLWAAPAGADSPRLTPYEETRYGSSLWEVPREPYQSRYRQEKYKAGLAEPPAAPGPRKSELNYLLPGPFRKPGPGEERVQRRFQSRMQWENEQRRISERSRPRVPAPIQ